MRKLFLLVLVIVVVLAAVVVYIPSQSDAVDVVTTPPVHARNETWYREFCAQHPADCLPPADDPPNDPIDDPLPPCETSPPPCTPAAPQPTIGTAFVKITLHFTDNTERIITGQASLLTVIIPGREVKEVEWISYDVEVQFEGLGDVAISNLRMGLYLVPADGSSISVMPRQFGDSVTVLEGARISIIRAYTVQASDIEAASDPTTTAILYKLRFYSSFTWLGTIDGIPMFAQASISGPDISASVRNVS